jgi:hypothetical protein
MRDIEAEIRQNKARWEKVAEEMEEVEWGVQQ